MLDWLKQLFSSSSLSSFDDAVTRERIIQNGRIIFIDDETPLLISELQKSGFAVDHDQTGDDLSKLDSQLYDVAIVDFYGVGKRLGTGQGLELLKHIRRVSPRTRLMAYTSRSLSANESEFFRLSHVVLPKDMGLGDSMALIETQLRAAFSKQHLLDSLLAKLEISDSQTKGKIQDSLIKALRSKDEGGFRKRLVSLIGKISEKGVDLIISRVFGS